jgi:hypothetical protein
VARRATPPRRAARGPRRDGRPGRSASGSSRRTASARRASGPGGGSPRSTVRRGADRATPAWRCDDGSRRERGGARPSASSRPPPVRPSSRALKPSRPLRGGMQPPEHRDDGTDARALCERTGVPLERHHLVPENRARSPVAPVCPPCHDQLHATFTDEELRESYDTVEALRESDRMAGSSRSSRGRTRWPWPSPSRPTSASAGARADRRRAVRVARSGDRDAGRAGPREASPTRRRTTRLPRFGVATARARRSRARRRTAPG